MRVDKINVSYKTQNYNRNNVYKNASFDKISFRGSEDKKEPSGLKKIIGFFLPDVEELSPEEERSLEISDMLSDIDSQLKRLKKDAKWEKMMLHDYMKIGEYDNFEGYIPIDKKSGRKLKFGEIDKETGRPKEFTVINTKEGFRADSSYNLIDGEEAFQKTDYSFEGVISSSDYIKGKFVYMKQEHINEKLTYEMVPYANGFYYFCGKKDEFDKPIEIIFEADISYDKDKVSTVNLTEDDGTLKHYYFDNQKRIWIEK